MTIKKVWLFALVLAVLLGVSGFNAYQQVKRGSDAYIYGYPLVLMELTRQALSSAGADLGTNHFTHHQTFPDHNARNVVRPNHDTLYSIAWVDLTHQPIVLSVPNTQGRYYVMPLMDAWSNVFATVGKRSYGTQAGDYLIAGPQWQGTVPDTTVKIDSPTDRVWIIGRIQTNGKADIPNVAELQEQFTLTPLERWNQRLANPSNLVLESTPPPVLDPYQQIEQMTAAEFFTLLADLMREQRAGPLDGPALEELPKIGLIPGQEFEADQLSWMDHYLLDYALKVTRSKIKDRLENNRTLENGWLVRRDSIGEYGTNYVMRAAVAMIGLGALPPAEASYPNTAVDSQGAVLSGSRSYRLHFPAGETPPVNAFWSLTLYDQDGFLVANPIDRYALGDRDELVYSADGSLNLLIQQVAPREGQSNWLPAPEGEFALTLRLYHPKPEFLAGSWQLPAVKRL